MDLTGSKWRFVQIAYSLILCGCGGESQPSRSPARELPPVPPRLAFPDRQTSPVRKPPPQSAQELADDPSISTVRSEVTAERAATDVVSDRVAANLRAAGVRSISSKHLTLFTDLPTNPSIEELPKVFDLAVPQWCSYFAVDTASVEAWHQTAYLIRDQELFRRLGAIRNDLPRFDHGYQKGAEIWLYEQPSDYYRRHLLLHEGTHGFMHHFLRGAGPPWYMEGTAELLATHRWSEEQLQLKWFPGDRQETPYWGRIKAIRDDIAAGDRRSLEQILRYDRRAHRDVEAYAWCWAAASFLDHHPLTHQRFLELRSAADDPTIRFSQRFQSGLKLQWPFLAHAWQDFVERLSYGYDLESESFSPIPAAPPGDGPRELTVTAAGGWQSTGLSLVAEEAYQLEARGRYQLGTQPKIWWSEPNGVTVRYYNGFPLGMLLAAVIDEGVVPRQSPLLRPQPVGIGRRFVAPQSGVLYLRVNDDPAESGDNQGEVSILFRRSPAAGDHPN